MPKHEQKEMPDVKSIKRANKGPQKQWWGCLEPVFLIIAISTAIVALASLLAWSVISFSIPPNVYSIRTDAFELTNEQYLQIEYPNIVFGGNDPVYITLIISGNPSKKQEVEVQVKLPPGLTLIEPPDQAGKPFGTIILEEPENVTSEETENTTRDQEFALGVINSQSLWAFRRVESQLVSIHSASVDVPVEFDIGIETVPWMSARGLVNNTFNERSPLILLVTGFLSGAGTLAFQYAKSRRDISWDEQQKKEKDFSERLKEDLVGAIKFLLNLDRSVYTGKESDFDTYKRMIVLSGWEDKLPILVLEKLKSRKIYEAKQVAENLRDLCHEFNPKPGLEDRYKHLKSLNVFCDLLLVENLRERPVTKEEASCMLLAYKHWHELKPLITSLIYEFAHLPANLPILNSVFVSDNDGLQLLIDANIQKNIDHISQIEDDSEENKAASNINRHLTLDIKWRALWSAKNRKQSDKVQRWLSGHWYENVDENFSLGSEYAELDGKLRDSAIEHPISKQVSGPFPVIVFGDEGMGKTASAFWLASQLQKSAEADAEDYKAFPVYAPFEAGVDLREWLVEKISRALIDFTADNPRRFLTAPDSQKTAMGRLMLWHTKSADTLRLNFYSSPFNSSASDIEQVLEYITKFKHRKFAAKLTREEMYNLLFMARPDIFDQIHFFWDIRSAAPQEEVVSKIREMEGLAVHLARQNLIVKIFAPLAAQETLRGLAGFEFTNNNGFIWDEDQLKELVEKRIDKFDALWEKSINDPLGLIVAAADHSPRRTIQILVHLMDYVEEHLQEGERLNQKHFRASIAQP